MKQIEFDESQLGDLNALGEMLFSDPDDPTSPNYKRKLVRPKIHFVRILLNCIIPLLVTFGLYYLLSELGVHGTYANLIAFAALCVYVFIRLKSIIICMVRIYQRFAPDSIRNKCRFEPSCSQYMILSLQKYGLFKGLHKGICRLKRCNIHNGGFDEP